MTNGLFKYFPPDGDKLELFTSGHVLLTPPECLDDPWDFFVRFERVTEAELKREVPMSSSFRPQDFKELREVVTSAAFLAGESCSYQKETG